MSKDYGVTKRFEDLENRPQGGGKLPENYLYNTSFEVVSGNTINPRLEWWKGEYGYNTSEPYGGRRSVEIESNDGYIETSMERVWLSSVGADIESRYTGETSTEPLEGSKWDYQETILSFYYKGQGVNVVVSTDDTQVARESAPYAESWTRFHMRIPALESHNEFKIRVDNSGLFSGVTTTLDCFQLERVTESGEPSTYVPGKYSTTDLGLATRELERTAERITGLERETWKPKFNMIYNSSFLKRDMYGDASFWYTYYPYRNRVEPAYTDTWYDLEDFRQTITNYDQVASELPHFAFIRTFSRLIPKVESGKGGFYLPDSPDRAYYHFSFYAVAQLGDDRNPFDATLRVRLINMDDDSKEPIVIGDIVVSRSSGIGEWSNSTASPAVEHIKSVANKQYHYWHKYDLVFRVEDDTLNTSDRMGITLSDETDEYGAFWLIGKMMLQVLDGGDFSYLGHDYVEGGGNILEPSTLEDSRIGNLSDLNTSNKDTIVDAVNEVLSGQGGILEEIDPKVGDLSLLATNNKSNVVSALNEVFNDVDEGKRSIASALTDKQQPATGDETFTELSNKIRAIETGTTNPPPTGQTSNLSLISEVATPSASVYGSGTEPEPDYQGVPLIIYTDDMSSFEVAVLASDLRFELGSPRVRLGATRHKRDVFVQHISRMPINTYPHKPLLALSGKATTSDNTVKSYIESMNIKIPVFDLSFSPETGCLRNLLLGTGTPISLPSSGSVVGNTFIKPSSSIFPKMAGKSVALPIYPFKSKSNYFPIMLSSTKLDETYVRKSSTTVNYNDVTLLTNQYNSWSQSSYPEARNSDWTESKVDGDRYITNAKIADNGRSVAYFGFSAVPGTQLTFDYKVSSERNYDFFQVYYNGFSILKVSGEIGWTNFAYNLTTQEPARITLEYTKDSSVSQGSDAAFVRNIGFKSATEVVVDPNNYTDYSHTYLQNVGGSKLAVYCAWVSSTGNYTSSPMGSYEYTNYQDANEYIWSLLIWGDEI